MKVLNIHSRVIKQPIQNALELFATLATKEDKIWPIEHWPPMRFKEGLKIGAMGGHGPIRYEVIDYHTHHVTFKFQQPAGFNGIHQLEMTALDPATFEIKHTIDMTTNGTGTIAWLLAIRSLHDALMEDAFDKIENLLTQSNRKTSWSLWVKAWRYLLSPKS